MYYFIKLLLLIFLYSRDLHVIANEKLPELIVCEQRCQANNQHCQATPGGYQCVPQTQSKLIKDEKAKEKEIDEIDRLRQEAEQRHNKPAGLKQHRLPHHPEADKSAQAHSVHHGSHNHPHKEKLQAVHHKATTIAPPVQPKQHHLSGSVLKPETEPVQLKQHHSGSVLEPKHHNREGELHSGELKHHEAPPRESEHHHKAPSGEYQHHRIKAPAEDYEPQQQHHSKEHKPHHEESNNNNRHHTEEANKHHKSKAKAKHEDHVISNTDNLPATTTDKAKDNAAFAHAPQAIQSKPGGDGRHNQLREATSMADVYFLENQKVVPNFKVVDSSQGKDEILLQSRDPDDPEKPKSEAIQSNPSNGNTAGESSIGTPIFIAVVAGCSIAGLVGLVVAGVCWYRLQKNVKAASEAEYPAYGVTGPAREKVGSPGDRKLAQSAQMYHYQHQKQQMLAMERANGDMGGNGSDVDSEEENEEGDYTVYECPGLAPTGEMEVKNPLFNDDTPVSGSNGEQPQK